MRAVLIAAATFALLVNHAQAAEYKTTAQALVNICNWPGAAGQMTGSPEMAARCQARTLGEVDGVIEGMKLSRGKPWICMPVDSGPNERILVVQKYIGDHPEALSADVGDMVAAALAQAYPCPKSSR